MLALLFLALVGSNLYVSYQWRQGQKEIHRLRDELGYLEIDDPTRFYVRESGLKFDDHTWQWRVYVPPGDYGLMTAGARIPATGTEDAARSGGSFYHKGEFTMTARVEFDSAYDCWFVVVSGPSWRYTCTIPLENTDWLNSTVPLLMEVAGRSGQSSYAPGEPTVLLRVRAGNSDEPSDGLMVWFEPSRHGRRQPDAGVQQPGSN